MKKLRSGYTTGACAAAAARGAIELLLSREASKDVTIPFPDRSRVSFPLHECRICNTGLNEKIAYASVLKDAGDDPDVTNGAEIGAEVMLSPGAVEHSVVILAGEGVGIATKPGLAVEVGEPAINPVPLKMIRNAVLEAVANYNLKRFQKITVTVIVPKGKELAEKTLNERLGILGGISILGTTGIVRPISAKAWTDTVTATMEVAKAGDNQEIVLSTGRTSEKALQDLLSLKPEAYIMMGDYLEYALKEAGRFKFSRIHMAGMWAKILKASLRIPQTHVRFGVLEVENAIEKIKVHYPDKDLRFLAGANTAREIYHRLEQKDEYDVIEGICQEAGLYHFETSGVPVTVYLVHHTGEIPVKVDVG